MIETVETVWPDLKKGIVNTDRIIQVVKLVGLFGALQSGLEKSDRPVKVGAGVATAGREGNPGKDEIAPVGDQIFSENWKPFIWPEFKPVFMDWPGWDEILIDRQPPIIKAGPLGAGKSLTLGIRQLQEEGVAAIRKWGEGLASITVEPQSIKRYSSDALIMLEAAKRLCGIMIINR